LGEAAPLPGFSVEGVDEALEAVESWRAFVPESLADVETIASAGLPPSASHGVEQALLGWLASTKGESVARLLGATHTARVAVNALAGDAAQARAAVAAGFKTIKVKVGIAPVDEDVRRVRNIRDAVGPTVALRLDANRAWSADDAERALRALADVGIELVEEPTKGLAALARLRAFASIGADESVRTESDLDRVLREGAADAIVVKPMLVGSLLASVRMLKRAAKANVDSVVTTALEGGVGRCGAWAVAAAGPATLACGLDTGSWLASDIHPGPRVERGWACGGAC